MMVGEKIRLKDHTTKEEIFLAQREHYIAVCDCTDMSASEIMKEFHTIWLDNKTFMIIKEILSFSKCEDGIMFGKYNKEV